MPKFGISYAIISDFYVEVEAESELEAEKMLLESANPANDIGGSEPDFMTSDIDHNDYVIDRL